MFPILAGSGILSAYELIKGQNALDELHRQKVPAFAETPEMAASRARADSMSAYGYSPQEKSSFRNNVAQDINTQSQRALDLGGGQLGKVIAGQGKINEIGAENKFATGDAELHRRNIANADKFSQQLQSLSNMNVQQQLKQRYAAEQALGGAVKTGLSGLASTANLAQILGGGLGGSKEGTGGVSDLMGLGGNNTANSTGSYYTPIAEQSTIQPSADYSDILSQLIFNGSRRPR